MRSSGQGRNGKETDNGIALFSPKLSHPCETMLVMASEPKTRQLRSSNPDYLTLLNLFAEKEWEGRASLPLTDPDLDRLGFYTKYNRGPLASLFRNWKTARTVKRGGVTCAAWLSSTVPPAPDLFASVMTSCSYFKDKPSHNCDGTWPYVESFKLELQKPQHATTIVYLRQSFIAAVSARAVSSSKELPRKSVAYMKSKLELMTVAKNKFLSECYPTTPSQPPTPPDPALSRQRCVSAGIFIAFVNLFEATIVDAVAATSLPDLKQPPHDRRGRTGRDGAHYEPPAQV